MSSNGAIVKAEDVHKSFGRQLALCGVNMEVAPRDVVVIVGVVVYQLLKRREWLSGAGWATVALLASLGWLMPWYIIWLLPLAAIATDARLRVVALGATLLVTLSFMPVVLPFLKHHGINPMSGNVGVNAVKFQRLAQSAPLGEVR